MNTDGLWFHTKHHARVHIPVVISYIVIAWNTQWLPWPGLSIYFCHVLSMFLSSVPSLFCLHFQVFYSICSSILLSNSLQLLSQVHRGEYSKIPSAEIFNTCQCQLSTLQFMSPLVDNSLTFSHTIISYYTFIKYDLITTISEHTFVTVIIFLQ